MRSDRSGIVRESRPLGIAEALHTDEVSEILRIAHARGVPVVPRGAGTGLSGGAAAGGGEIVLSLSRMNRILEIDPVDQVARVEAGVLNADISHAALPYGLLYAPDPASRAISTIGGNIATNAGGLRCAKYGVTREAVLALTAVLADGRVIHTGRRSLKGVTGYDLTALLVGSEGTLAVITEATVRLVPLSSTPPTTVVAVLPGLPAALTLCSRILSGSSTILSDDSSIAASERTAAPERPSTLELLDPSTVTAVDQYVPANERDGILQDIRPGAAVVIGQWDTADSADWAERAAAMAEAVGGRAEVLVGEAAGERALDFRRALNPALSSLGDALIEDVCVPRSKLPDMYREIARIEAETGLTIPAGAHAADGNLHPHFLVPAAERESDGGVPQLVWDAADALFRAALALGGTLTGEHGVGLLKARWLSAEFGADELDLQLGIRELFDPTQILNPGKGVI
nr:MULTISPECIES: FAD-binding protein [unclassified Leucobacter]